jgi:hypothetical protein
MLISGRMHEQTSLLDDKTNVGSGKSKILKCSDETSIFCGIIKWTPIGDGWFGFGVGRREARVALGHVGTVKKISSILML